MLVLRGFPFRGDLSTEACLRMAEVCSDVRREHGYRLTPGSLTERSSRETQSNPEVLCSLVTIVFLSILNFAGSLHLPAAAMQHICQVDVIVPYTLQRRPNIVCSYKIHLETALL